MKTDKCKICRRAGDKLFLKGDRCNSVKCSMIRKPYAPGQKGKRRPKPLSEYGKQLKEKQKLKNWYNLRETQFSNYVKSVLEKKSGAEDAPVKLIQLLEKRLDNVIFRLGFAASRNKARQIVSHRHILVNGRIVNISSFSVKKDDKIQIRPSSVNKPIFKDLAASLKKYVTPSWLLLKIDQFEGTVKLEPVLEEAAPPIELSSVFEFYSK
ncbi:MAG: 30S ribosomal protein S4 [Patescibacteria group bacterium]